MDEIAIDMFLETDVNSTIRLLKPSAYAFGYHISRRLLPLVQSYLQPATGRSEGSRKGPGLKLEISSCTRI